MFCCRESRRSILRSDNCNRQPAGGLERYDMRIRSCVKGFLGARSSTLPTVSELPPRRFRRRRVCATALRSLRSTVELSAQRGSRPLANAIRSPIRLTAWRPANTASLLSSVACFEHVPAEAVWRGCRSKESSTRAHRRYASVKLQRPLRLAHTFDTRGESIYRGGWLDL
jgi:hypothetical protein